MFTLIKNLTAAWAAMLPLRLPNFGMILKLYISLNWASIGLITAPSLVMQCYLPNAIRHVQVHSEMFIDNSTEQTSINK